MKQTFSEKYLLVIRIQNGVQLSKTVYKMSRILNG